MSDELLRPPDGEENDMETVPEDAPPHVEDDESEMVTGEELRDAVEDIGARFKTAGLKPFRQMLRSYVNQTLDAVDGLLNALEGNKRKKG